MKYSTWNKLKVASMICLSLAIGCVAPISASAMDMVVEKTTINEYDMVKKSIEELKKNPKNFTTEEIAQLENYKDTFKYHIDEMDDLTDKELKALDYDEEQIYAIRNYDGSEEMMEKSSANVDLTLEKKSSSYANGISNLSVFAKFAWRGTPAFQFQDAFGVTNGEMMYFTNYNNPFSTTYLTTTGKQKSFSGYLTRQQNGNTGTTTKFDILRYESDGKYYLKSGSANIPMYRKDSVKDCGVGVTYGHAYATPTIGISVSGEGASVGISFSPAVSRKDTNKIFTIY